MEAVYTFNEVGGQLWRLLAEARAAEDLVEWVSQNFNVGTEVAEADVHAFLDDLREIGLIDAVGLFGEKRGNEAREKKLSLAR